MNYEYCQRNRLEEPHTYMYTPFEGEALLDSYRDNRISAMRVYSAAPDQGGEFDGALVRHAASRLERIFARESFAIPDPFRNLAGLVKPLPTEHLPTLASLRRPTAIPLRSLALKDPVDTSELLQALIIAQLADAVGTPEMAWLDRLVQRFEVSKKMYDAYLPGFRKGEGANTTLRLYWLFGLALSFGFLESNNLKYLNTLLKSCDLLCSLPGDLVREQVPASGMKLLLATELSCVDLIARRNEVLLALG